MEYAVLISIFILISSWEYCMFFYKKNLLPYRNGYNIFSVFQRIIISIALVKIFGWIYGILLILFSAFLLQYITHFTLGIIISLLFKNKPLPGIGLFSIMTRVTGILTILLFFF